MEKFGKIEEIGKGEKPEMIVYDYMDFRTFLKDLYEQEKAQKRYFSFRYFARIAGFSSPSYLKMVIDGKRNLSPSSIHKFSKALKLPKREAGYFEALVLFNQAKSEKEKDLYFERLSALKPRSKMRGLKKDEYEYFTKKHFVILRELVALPDFLEDTKWIADHIRHSVKPKDIEHAIEVLLRIGLLERDENGMLVQGDASITTPAEVDSLEVYNFHRSMLGDAKDAMVEVPTDFRDITSLTIPIPESALPEMKRRIKEFREEMIDYINKGNADYFEVYQLNLQLFPVTKVSNRKKK